MADPLEFLDTNTMSEQERNALAAVTGASQPTLEPVALVPDMSQPAAAAPAVAEAPVVIDGVVEGAHSVPLATFLDMRDRATKAKERADALEAASQVHEPVEFNIPDAATDPAGNAAARQALTNLQILSERMNFSEDYARLKYKDETELVDTAQQWAIAKFKADPAYEDRIMNERNPYETIIADYRSSKQLEAFAGDEWTQFQAWKAGQAGGNISAAAPVIVQPVGVAPVAPTPQQPARPLPPRSIADLPSAGGNAHLIAVGAGQAFDSVFPMR